MRLSIWLAALAPVALAAPTYDAWKPAEAQDSKAVSAYFKSLVKCVGQSKVAGVAPACDMSKAVMPVCMYTTSEMERYSRLTFALQPPSHYPSQQQASH